MSTFIEPLVLNEADTISGLLTTYIAPETASDVVLGLSVFTCKEPDTVSTLVLVL
jgi:hypothetical protein